MSILKKKIETKKQLPDSFVGMPELFFADYEKLSDCLQNALGLEMQAHKSVSAKLSCFAIGGLFDFDDFEDDLGGAVFSVGTTQNKPVEIFIKLSDNLAGMLVEKKLTGNINTKPDSKKEFGKFDLLIIQPLADLLKKQLENKTDSQKLKILQCGDEVKNNLIAKDMDWLKIKLTFLRKQKQADKKADKKTDKEIGKAADFFITLYISSKIAKKIITKSKLDNANIINPDNPWHAHFLQIAKNAKMPLQIIIEDLKLSVAECTRLELGQVISLPGASHEQIMIKAHGQKRQAKTQIDIASARLGVFKAVKAVKLNHDIAPEFWAGFDELP